MSSLRQKRYQVGLWGERIAALLLRCKGYSLLARRYRTPLGEIDLIARRGSRIAFVEVKYRQTLDEAAWSLTSNQKQRIIRAAHLWLQNHSGESFESLSFDVILVAPRRLPRHISGAFNDL